MSDTIGSLKIRVVLKAGDVRTGDAPSLRFLRWRLTHVEAELTTCASEEQGPGIAESGE